MTLLIVAFGYLALGTVSGFLLCAWLVGVGQQKRQDQ